MDPTSCFCAQPTRREIIRLAKDCKDINDALGDWKDGRCTWEQAMMAAANRLAGRISMLSSHTNKDTPAATHPILPE